MMDIFTKVKRMAEGNINFMMVLYMMVNLRITRLMGKASILIKKRDINILGSLNQDRKKAKVSK
jgi:hypothetical protein